VGTICSIGWLDEPKTCSATTPLTKAGSTSVARCPSAVATAGLTDTVRATPPMSV